MQEEAYEVEEGSQCVSYQDVVLAKRITFHDIMDHVTGPFISVVLHIVLISLLGVIIVIDPEEKRPEIELEVIEDEGVEIDEIPDPPENLDDVEIYKSDIDQSAAKPDPVDIPDIKDIPVENDMIDVQIPDLVKIKPNKSVYKLTGVYERRSEAGRKLTAKMYPEVARSDIHVTKGLDWLAKVQKKDGSWGDGSISPAMTALATLAFLAHGETTLSQGYGLTVLKALKKLVEFQNKMNDHSNSYMNGMTTYALAEAYVLTKIPQVEKAMNKGVAIIVKGMNSNGSFNYGYNNKPQVPIKDPKTGKMRINKYIGEPRSDLSVAGWNYQALKAASTAGCSVEGLEEAIDRAVELGLKKSHYNRMHGAFSYSGGKIGGGGVSPTMTAVGTLCLQLFGAGGSPQAHRGLKWLENIGEGRLMVCNWRKNPAHWALYQWYYQTQAIFQGHGGKGKHWRKWNREFSRALIREQSSEGYWKSPLAKYHKPKKRDKPTHGENGHCFKTDMNLKVYCTALCTLMLEVYYRYLPTFKVAKAKPIKRKGFEIEDKDLGLNLN